MILEELRIRNWRGHRNQRTFRFDPGLNLIVGPNESGKSTLFEALVRGLFDRHGSRARELERIRPLGSTLGPEVQLTLVSEGRRYRVFKRFLSEPRSELWVERDGELELDHEGDKADEAVRELQRGERSARGAAQAAHRGLAHALWYLQSDEALPRGEWNAALQEGLQGLMRLSLRTPEQDAVLAALEREVSAVFTPTGRVARGGPLAAQRELVAGLEREVAGSRQELDRLAGYRLQLADLLSQRERIDSELEALRGELASLEEQLSHAGAIEERERQCTLRVEEAQRKHEECRRLLARAEALQERARQLTLQLAESEEVLSKLRGAVREHRREAEVHARRWEDELEPRRDVVRGQLEELRAKQRIEQLELEQRELEARRRRRAELERQVAERASKLEELNAPDEPLWREIKQLWERAKTLDERLRASAVGVRFELGDVSVTPDGEVGRDQATGEYLVTRPVAFQLSNLGSVRVRATSGDADRWREELAASRAQLDEQLRCFAASDFEALAAKRKRRRSLESEIEQRHGRLAEVGEAGERRSRELRAELDDLRARVPQPVLPGMEGWAEERTSEQVRELERREARLAEAIREAREAEQAADRAYHAKQSELTAAAQQTSSLRSQLQALAEQLEELLPEAGKVEALMAALSAAERELAGRQAELHAVGEELRRTVEEPRRRRREVLEGLDRAHRQRAEIEAQVVDRTARVEEAVERGLEGRGDDLDGRLQAARSRLARLEQRSAALRLLKALAEHHLEERATALIAPVTELVEGWLRRLTGRAYSGLALDQRLVPTALQPARYEDALPVESLSFGTHEQVVVLLRLALAVLLSREQRQLVVLDDRLVNADARRMAALREILAEAAQSCQILIATCDDRPYAGLAMRRLELEGSAPVRPAPVPEEEAVSVPGEPPGRPEDPLP